MADVSFSAGSDEECEILVGMVHDRLPREYAHQPIRIVESETSDENHSTTASEEESTAEEATENRLASVNTWCRCGMCESETLGDEKEAICCLEVPNCVKMIAAGQKRYALAFLALLALVVVSMFFSSSKLQASLFGSEELLDDILRKRAIDNIIILVCVDSGYSRMAMNLYYTSFHKLSINNYLFMGTDDQICATLQKQGFACYTYQESPIHDSVSNWGTVEFSRKTHHKTKVTLDALLLGYTVLLVDVDIIFFHNPFPYLICKRCDIQIQNDMTEGNSGFYLARPTTASITLHQKAYNASLLPGALSNQKVLDRIMERMSQEHELVMQTLPKKQFPNGEVYFEEGRRMFANDNPCNDCVIVHNNWMLTGAAKELRFKESGLWQVDTNGYYSDPNNKYILYHNPEDFGPQVTLEVETKALKAALVLGQVLNRTVILPRFHCYGCIYGACKNKHERCAFGTFYKVADFDKSFSGAYRESSFLEHPLVPHDIKTSLSPEFFISTKSNLQPKTPGKVHLRKPINGHTPSPSEIRLWFKNLSKYHILQFHSLYDSFKHFEGFINTNKKFAQAFVKCNYRNFKQT
ncbi:hypothetical protein CAPTEDRAFT_212399 [Capitella teleta]|uniref:Nucleotide-diphospho-sugar transferase domain-containing protein n=2 Tax=Capitella teleta TaxID=283909 RepID=R7U4V5_CAPTE|nr:hypothetical protein CAPTEDRAFT_212399 [Capitella teleta]|eukprot:ELT98190.1 hypothetical protein CAPTEDRAFT_212399 [Capitella teleta]